MAIMVAGGLTFAFPPAIPAMAQQSNPNLSVSAESSTFGNYVSGAQVVEVVIIDPDIDETNEAKGEPDVTVNGNKLRMVQATDGKWYGYIADRVRATEADSTTTVPGKGLDFGTICSTANAVKLLDAAVGDAPGNPNFFSDATAVAFPVSASRLYTVTTPGTEGSQPAASAPIASCLTDNLVEATFTDAPATGSLPTAGGVYYYLLSGDANNVVREAKEANYSTTTAIGFGQSIDGTLPAGAAEARAQTAALWPFVQMYDFNPTGEVIVRYNRGGGTQSVTLNYDTVDQYAELSLDRATYPPGSQVHFTITDTWLDIDPTDEDSWTWDVEGTNMGAAYYQAFDENGMAQGTDVPNVAPYLDADLMCDNNCILLLERNTQGTNVVEYAENGDSNTALGASPSTTGATVDGLLTVTETSATSGVFRSYDDNDQSVLVAAASPPRDTTATIDYNETPRSITVGYATATIDIQPSGDAWLSGQEIPIVLTDADFNRNTRADEDFAASSPVPVPGIVTWSWTGVPRRS